LGPDRLRVPTRGVPIRSGSRSQDTSLLLGTKLSTSPCESLAAEPSNRVRSSYRSRSIWTKDDGDPSKSDASELRTWTGRPVRPGQVRLPQSGASARSGYPPVRAGICMFWRVENRGPKTLDFGSQLGGSSRRGPEGGPRGSGPWSRGGTLIVAARRSNR
jgi:hypothetical protein